MRSDVAVEETVAYSAGVTIGAEKVTDPAVHHGERRVWSKRRSPRRLGALHG
jgi:hypothetical protein